MAGFALLLRFLNWRQAAALAAVALLFNAFALARVAPGILRKSDGQRARTGLLYYPLSVLLLLLVFRERLDIVAAAWGVMAFGDGFATLVGSQSPGPRLQWNPQKSWYGLFAFIAAGSLGSVSLCLWTVQSWADRPEAEYLVAGPIIATVIAAFVETLPLKLDDNLSVPAAAGTVMWIAAHVGRGVDEWRDLAGAIIISAPIALVAWRSRAISGGGATAGFVCAVIIYLGAGLAGIAVLGVALAITLLSSRLGRRRKEALGIAEEHGGMRGVGNILANCAVGTTGALLAAFAPGLPGEAGPVIFVTAIAAGASDTVASEIGKAFGGQPRAFPTFRAVAPGTPGAVSIVGTVAGVIAAALIALPAVAMWLIVPERVPLVVAACTAGALVESALATRFEREGVLDNHTLNLLNTASAAALAVWWISR
jgi:uncharacterized protein (TIGR00297 family)